MQAANVNVQTRQSLRCSHKLHFCSHKWHPNHHEILVFWRNCKICTGSPEPSLQYQNLMYWLEWRSVAFTRTAKVLTSLHICSSELSSLDNAISNKNLTWWLKWRVGCHFNSMRAAKTLASLHICKGPPEPSSQ